MRIICICPVCGSREYFMSSAVTIDNDRISICHECERTWYQTDRHVSLPLRNDPQAGYRKLAQLSDVSISMLFDEFQDHI